MNARSVARLDKVHGALRLVLTEAAKTSPVSFEISETLRSVARQRQLVDAGASMTMNSRHLAHPQTGLAMAADIYCTVNGKLRWDWPLYAKAADHIKRIALERDIHIVWGGDWRKLKDGPHFELSRQSYP